MGISEERSSWSTARIKPISAPTCTSSMPTAISSESSIEPSSSLLRAFFLSSCPAMEWCQKSLRPLFPFRQQKCNNKAPGVSGA
eukprot:m.123044 g.123044  ORF g.123044 m.123044 type:complete len:84 (-) comp52138_c0_seq1:1142-1393(-)